MLTFVNVSCFVVLNVFMKNYVYNILCWMLYMFRTNLVVHHQQHVIIYCITQFGTMVQASLVSISQTGLHDCTKLRDKVY